MPRFTFALVRLSSYMRQVDLAPTVETVSRHETMETALKAFDRKYSRDDECSFRLMELDRHGQCAGNGYMRIAEARRCVA